MPNRMRAGVVAAAGIGCTLLLPATAAPTRTPLTSSVAVSAAPAMPPSPFLVGPSPSVTQRRPGPGDTVPVYAQDQHWLDGAGQSWAMREQGHGQAVWLYQEPAGPPLDEIGGKQAGRRIWHPAG